MGKQHKVQANVQYSHSGALMSSEQPLAEQNLYLSRGHWAVSTSAQYSMTFALGWLTERIPHYTHSISTLLKQIENCQNLLLFSSSIFSANICTKNKIKCHSSNKIIVFILLSTQAHTNIIPTRINNNRTLHHAPQTTINPTSSTDI